MLSFMLSRTEKFKLALAASVLSLMPAATLPAHAQTEVARTPWQVTGGKICASGTCRVYFPLVAANRRLDLQFVSCFVAGPGLEPSVFFLGVDDALALGVKHTLVPFERTYNSEALFEVSQPIVFSIAAGHRPQIAFFYSGSATGGSSCSLSGEQVFLQ